MMVTLNQSFVFPSLELIHLYLKMDHHTPISYLSSVPTDIFNEIIQKNIEDITTILSLMLTSKIIRDRTRLAVKRISNDPHHYVSQIPLSFLTQFPNLEYVEQMVILGPEDIHDICHLSKLRHVNFIIRIPKSNNDLSPSYNNIIDYVVPILSFLVSKDKNLDIKILAELPHIKRYVGFILRNFKFLIVGRYLPQLKYGYLDRYITKILRLDPRLSLFLHSSGSIYKYTSMLLVDLMTEGRLFGTTDTMSLTPTFTLNHQAKAFLRSTDFGPIDPTKLEDESVNPSVKSLIKDLNFTTERILYLILSIYWHRRSCDFKDIARTIFGDLKTETWTLVMIVSAIMIHDHIDQDDLFGSDEMFDLPNEIIDIERITNLSTILSQTHLIYLSGDAMGL